MKKIVVFLFYFIVARALRVWQCSFSGRIKVAFISNYRDEADVIRFGFWGIKNTPDVLPWICYEWEGIQGRLFMIGSITEQVVGEKATRESKKRAKEQFVVAVQKAYKLGARTILLAAATKRLFQKKELQELFPDVLFTMGDNFTALLLQKRIEEAFKLSNLAPQKSKAVVVAPHGFLGTVALQYLQKSGCKVVGLGKTDKRAEFKKYADKHNFQPVYSFSEAGRADMVVACSSDPQYLLQLANISSLCNRHKLIVIDPCEPYNVSPQVLKQCNGNVIRYDAGNGYSNHLNYIGGFIAWRLLRLSLGVTWGCFGEAFLIAKHPELMEQDWFTVSEENIMTVSKFFGEEEGQFGLPEPSCFGKPIYP